VLTAPSRATDLLLGSNRSVDDEARFARLSRIDWATLYKRVFDVDPLQCSSCDGRMRFVEVIEDGARARRQLDRRVFRRLRRLCREHAHRTVWTEATHSKG
jgi:hypothetical protein